jgi:hypothetical protein
VSSRYFRVLVSEIGYVRAVVEAYDGVAQVYAPDARRGEIEWAIADGQEPAADVIIARLAKEIDLQEIARPADWA